MKNLERGGKKNEKEKTYSYFLMRIAFQPFLVG